MGASSAVAMMSAGAPCSIWVTSAPEPPKLMSTVRSLYFDSSVSFTSLNASVRDAAAKTVRRPRTSIDGAFSRPLPQATSAVRIATREDGADLRRHGRQSTAARLREAVAVLAADHGYVYDLLIKLGLSDFAARTAEFILVRPLKIVLILLAAVAHRPRRRQGGAPVHSHRLPPLTGPHAGAARRTTGGHRRRRRRQRCARPRSRRRRVHGAR